MKKNILRLMTATMTAAIILSATGCGKSNSNNSIENYSESDIAQAINEYDKGQAEKREQIEKEQAAKEEAKKEAMQENNDIVPTDEILEADIFDYKIQIGDKCYTFPITVQEFIDSSDKIQIDETIQKVQLNDFVAGNTSNQKKTTPLCVKYNEYGIQLSTIVPSTLNETGCSFAETEILAFGNFNLGTEERPSPCIFAKGITTGSTISDFESSFNIKPVNETSRTDSNGKSFGINTYIKSLDEYDHSVQVTYYKDNGKIESIQYT